MSNTLKAVALALLTQTYDCGEPKSLDDLDYIYCNDKSYWDNLVQIAIDTLLSLDWLPPEALEGHVVVPMEPTPDMCIRGEIAWKRSLGQAVNDTDSAAACYRAMINNTTKGNTNGN